MREILKSFFPDESLKTFQRTLVAALTSLCVILLGTLLIWEVNLLIHVSKPTIFGYWGVAAVVTVAGAVAILAWRRYAHNTKGQIPPSTSKDNDKLVFIPPLGSRKEAQIIPPMAPAPTGKSIHDDDVDPLRQSGNSSIMDLKRHFDVMLTSNRLDEAEDILAQLQIIPEQSQWCENAQRRYSAKRQRAS